MRAAHFRTRKVCVCTGTGARAAPRLIRLTSLMASWKLMRRWISEIAAKARSIARCATRGEELRTRIATQVPKSGRARSMLGGGEHECIGGKQSAHAVSDMAARERRSGNIFDISIQLQR